MTLLQSALFDVGEMERAITAWKTKGAADYTPLEPLPR
jgi:enoyl-CoA hydratase